MLSLSDRDEVGAVLKVEGRGRKIVVEGKVFELGVVLKLTCVLVWTMMQLCYIEI